MDWHKTTLYPSFIELFWAIVRTEPPLRCARQIHDLQNTTEAALLILDQQLRMTPFLLGETISMADVPIGALVYRYRNLPIRRQDYPHIDAWYSRLTERPAYRKHVMFPFGDKPSEWYRLERGEAAQSRNDLLP